MITLKNQQTLNIMLDENVNGRKSMGFLSDFFEENSYNRSELNHWNDCIKEAEEKIKIEYAEALKEKEKAEKEAKLTREALEIHMEFRKKVVRELQTGIEVTLQQFKKFDIDSKIISSYEYSMGKNGIHGLVASKTRVMAFSDASGIGTFASTGGVALAPLAIVLVPVVILGIVSCLIVTEKDGEEAEQRYWKIQENIGSIMEAQCYYLEQISCFLQIRKVIDREKRTLDELLVHINTLNNQMKAVMKQRSFTVSEAKTAKSLPLLAEIVYKQFNAEMMEYGTNKINHEYQNIIEKLEEVNSKLKCVSGFSDENIAKILTGMI